MNHSELVLALAKTGRDVRDGLTHESANLLHMAVGISGESGELLDAVKKHSIYEMPIDRHNIIEELGDLEFYMEGLRQSLSITRDETIDGNMRKLQQRYGETYSNKAARERLDKATDN